jgi:predicted O-methyltransferase YrrM
MQIVLEKDAIDAIDMMELAESRGVFPEEVYFYQPPGKENYKLLVNIVRQLTPAHVVIDIGTSSGMSALALSGGGHSVITYDKVDLLNEDMKASFKKHNVTCKLCNCFEDETELVGIARSDLIMLDVDPHDGDVEIRFIESLKRLNFRGMVIMDDIHINDGMRKFWRDIDVAKYDVSAYGHWSGTGLVVFDETKFQIVMR